MNKSRLIALICICRAGKHWCLGSTASLTLKFCSFGSIYHAKYLIFVQNEALNTEMVRDQFNLHSETLIKNKHELRPMGLNYKTVAGKTERSLKRSVYFFMIH